MRIASFVSALFALSLLTSSPARACGVAGGLSAGAPRDGDVGVPTNVVPWVALVGDVDPSELRLLDASGTELAFELRSLGRSQLAVEYFELTPAAPLAPSARHRIVLPQLGEAGEVAFTTGEGPLEGAPPGPPEVELEVARRTGRISCDNVLACAHAETDADLEVVGPLGVALTSADVAMLWAQELDAGAGCYEVRARDLAGRRSEPTTVCVDDAEIRALPEDALAISCGADGVVVGEEDLDDLDTGSGCATGASAPSSAAPVLLALALLLARRARR